MLGEYLLHNICEIQQMASRQKTCSNLFESDLNARDILILYIIITRMTNYYPSTFYRKLSCNIFYPTRMPYSMISCKAEAVKVLK